MFVTYEVKAQEIKGSGTQTKTWNAPKFRVEILENKDDGLWDWHVTKEGDAMRLGGNSSSSFVGAMACANIYVAELIQREVANRK